MEPDFDQNAEQWLDVALARYGQVEPRAGLESDILARVRRESEPALKPWTSWWPVMIGTAAVAVLMLAAIVLHPQSRKQPEMAHTPNKLMIGGERPLASSTIRPSQTAPGSHVPSHPRPKQDGAPARTPPKRKQFPTPQPLSNQEQILASYVTEHPDRAILVARAQTALQQADRKQEGHPNPDGSVGPTLEERNP